MRRDGREGANEYLKMWNSTQASLRCLILVESKPQSSSEVVGSGVVFECLRSVANTHRSAEVSRGEVFCATFAVSHLAFQRQRETVTQQAAEMPRNAPLIAPHGVKKPPKTRKTNVFEGLGLPRRDSNPN